MGASLRGQPVAGADAEGTAAAPAGLITGGGAAGNAGPDGRKLAGAVLGPSAICARLSSEKACCRLRDEAE